MSAVERICSDLDAAIDALKSQGFRIDLIFPADEPWTAVMARGAETVRLTSRPDAPQPPDRLPRFQSEFVLTRGGGSGAGRAGMLYRDLIPSRLGGRYIASHITIPDGGPVADWVHFHRIAVQVIAVRGGSVRVVYEDQGEPFVMHPGDLVLQPPGIRHRVLESSPGLEVVELTCPAVHATYADHDLDLPTPRIARDRIYGGQRFLWHVAADSPWTPFAGGEAQETGLDAATGGLADARIVRPGRSPRLAFEAHDGELVFGFVLDGSARLEHDAGTVDVAPATAFVIPAEESWSLDALSADFRLLHLTTARIDENGLAAGDRSPV